MTEFVRIVLILVLIVLAPGIVALISRRQRKRSQRDLFALISEAESNNDDSKSLELIRDFLCTPCGLDGIWGVYRNSLVETATETLQAQLATIGHLHTLYQRARIPLPQELLDQSVGTIVSQQNVLDDDGLFSFVSSAPKKEFVERFEAAQKEKEHAARLLPKLI
ncbi:MAG TPA: hypothetical protein VHX65_03430 [Pirellulales bacterium]|jgi:hypothetical protein|nr:hypothetical protein [Pirellulales bacterium]